VAMTPMNFNEEVDLVELCVVRGEEEEEEAGDGDFHDCPQALEYHSVVECEKD